MNTKRTDQIMTTWGAWLAAKLQANGLSRAEFARRVGVSHVTVGRWLNGRVPDGQYIDAIADALVLDYDLVSERAGYRPRLPKDKLERIHRRLDPKAKRVKWNDSRFRLIEGMMDQFIQDDQLAEAREEDGKSSEAPSAPTSIRPRSDR